MVQETDSQSIEIKTAKETTPTQVYKSLAALAIPTFAQLIAEPVFVLIDTAIVGHVSNSALAGLSIGSTVLLTAVGLCLFLAYSTTSQVAHLLGAGKKRQGFEAGVDGIWLAAGIGIIAAFVLYLFAEPLCALIGAKGEVLAQASAYLHAVVIGMPGMLMVYAANGLFRGLQKIMLTVWAAIAGAVTNTVLDVLFVIVFGWGVAGSGWATALAQWTLCIILIIPALLWARAAGAGIGPHIRGILRSARVGSFLVIRTLALRVCMVGTVMLATAMGTQVLAAYQAVNATWNVIMNMLDAIGIAGQTLVAIELGAKRLPQARSLTKYAAQGGALSGIILAVGMVALGVPLVGLLSPDPQIQHLIITGFITLAIFLPLGGWMWALDGILIGAGDFRFLAKACTITACCYVPSLLFVRFLTSGSSETLQTVALWSVINIVFIGVRAITNGYRTRGGQWMHTTVGA